MFMTILKTKFLRIKIDEKDSLLDNIWSAKSSKMKDNQYKEVVTKQIELIEKYRPKKVLLDTTNFDFIISPTMQ